MGPRQGMDHLEEMGPQEEMDLLGEMVHREMVHHHLVTAEENQFMIAIQVVEVVRQTGGRGIPEEMNLETGLVPVVMTIVAGIVAVGLPERILIVKIEMTPDEMIEDLVDPDLGHLIDEDRVAEAPVVTEVLHEDPDVVTMKDRVAELENLPNGAHLLTEKGDLVDRYLDLHLAKRAPKNHQIRSPSFPLLTL